MAVGVKAAAGPPRPRLLRGGFGQHHQARLRPGPTDSTRRIGAQCTNDIGLERAIARRFRASCLAVGQKLGGQIARSVATTRLVPFVDTIGAVTAPSTKHPGGL